MKQDKTILELLLQIPKECTKITIQGVEMQLIDSTTQKQLLNQDSNDEHFHECILANGTFLFTIKNNKLHALYKIVPSSF